MCCLKYEQDAYESLIKTSPKNDSLVNTYDGVGTVTDTNLLKQTVKVRLEQDPSSIKTYNNCEICVLRNGKAKKTDPPIDTNIPPLPKPEKKPEQEEITLFDESRLSNYRQTDQPAERGQSGKPEAAGEARQSRRGKNRQERKSHPKGGENKKSRPPREKQETAPKTQEPQEKQEKQEAAKKSRNRKKRYYRSRTSGGQKSE